MLQNLDFNFDISQIDKFIMSHNESHNESPILAATIPATDDIVPHVVLNTTIGSPPHSSNMSSPTTPTSLASFRFGSNYNYNDVSSNNSSND
ncbi:3618_t:CDS:2, partial [Entrophospora sp. SA101]